MKKLSSFQSEGGAKCEKMVARATSSEVLQKLVFIKQAKRNSSWKLTREVSDEIWLRKSHSSCKMRN